MIIVIACLLRRPGARRLLDLAPAFVSPDLFNLVVSRPYDFVVQVRYAFLIGGDDGYLVADFEVSVGVGRVDMPVLD